jgi:hypothetical protein
LVRLVSKQRKGEGSGRGDQRREQQSIFFFFSIRERAQDQAGHERKYFFAGAGLDEELEGAKIGSNYFTKGLLKKRLINFSELRGCQGPSWPRS